MYAVLFALILIGAVLALVTGVGALRAWLRYRRARFGLQGRLAEDVARLAARTGEVQTRLATLEARASKLPVTVAELQHSLGTLRVLTDALSGSLAQAQRVLSYSALKTLSAERLARLFPTGSAGKRGRSG